MAENNVGLSDGLARESDAKLMLLVKEDQQDAFEQLVDRYRNRVVAIAHHMLGNLEEAEDLAQEVFMRVYRARKNYEPTAKFSTWLYTILNNLALNAIRDRKRKHVSHPQSVSESGTLGPSPMDQLAVDASGAMPSRVFAKGEMAAIVRAAVGQLPEEQRMAVVLNKFEDMSYKQISDVMGRSEMAVKSLLSRARCALRDILEPYFANGNLPKGMN